MMLLESQKKMIDSLFIEEDAQVEHHSADLEQLFDEVSSISPFKNENIERENMDDIDNALNILRRTDAEKENVIDEDIESMKKKLNL